MLKALQDPVPDFAPAIRAHFFEKREEIRNQMTVCFLSFRTSSTPIQLAGIDGHVPGMGGQAHPARDGCSVNAWGHARPCGELTDDSPEMIDGLHSST